MAWYIVYILAVAISSICLTAAGVNFKHPAWWVVIVCIILARISGIYGGNAP